MDKLSPDWCLVHVEGDCDCGDLGDRAAELVDDFAQDPYLSDVSELDWLEYLRAQHGEVRRG